MEKLVFLLLVLSTTANAQTSYRCIVNDVTTYQAQPCNGGHEEAIEIKESQKTVEATAKGGGVEIGRLEIKKGKDSSSYTYYHPKVSISNKTNDKIDVSLRYDGIDASGFMLEYFLLSGKVDAHSYKNLSDEKMVETEKYRKIVKWELHE